METKKKNSSSPSHLGSIPGSLQCRVFSGFLRQRKEIEFAELRQGRLSVVEYAERYIELGRFAPEVMMNETKKARRFEKGLRSELYRQVAVFALPHIRWC